LQVSIPLMLKLSLCYFFLYKTSLSKPTPSSSAVEISSP
jgi:hypothetical protein